MTVASIVTTDGACPFDGIEHDLELAPNRHILWKDVIGSAPKGIAKFLPTGDGHFPEDNDQVDGRFTIWTNAARAKPIEDRLPAYGAGWTFDLWLPGLADQTAVPGFANWSSGDQVWKLVKCIAPRGLQSLGRKGPIMDLYGYLLEFQFSANGGGTHLNERGLVSGGDFSVGPGVVPSVVAQKFMTHQIQDWSRTAPALPTQGWSNFGGVQHGRRRDAVIALDKLTCAQADEVVAWSRVQRHYPFSFTSANGFGPGIDYTVSCVLREIKVKRGAGWWWEITLDLSLT